MTLPPLPELRHIDAGDLRIAYFERGDGPLVLCLHGFPDTPWSFAHQLAALPAAGYRVVAPYLRGYPPTSTPQGPYQAAAFGQDVLALLDALEVERAAVYGHDWGSAGAYMAALLAPDRVERLVASAVPYGPGMPMALVTNPVQQRRSWYMFYFQTRLAEVAVPMNDHAFIDRLWEDWSPGFTAPAEVLRAIKASLAAPDGLDRALAYYRTALDPSRKAPDLWDIENRFGAEPLQVPTLYVHGARDGCIGVEVTDGMAALCTGGFERVILPDAGHFTHLEAPEAFNEAVLAFLGERAVT
jgi:pimeloyl-ACP methyl ester carboxylesterase